MDEKKRGKSGRKSNSTLSLSLQRKEKMMKKIWEQETATDNKRWLDFLFATNIQKWNFWFSFFFNILILPLCLQILFWLWCFLLSFEYRIRLHSLTYISSLIQNMEWGGRNSGKISPLLSFR
jgi:hypothetical protein